MIEHNIKDNLDSVILKGLYHMLELNALFVVLALRGVAGIWCKKADGVISPVVKKGLSVDLPLVSGLVKLEDWHQLYSCNTKSF